MTATVVGRSVVFHGPQSQSDKDAAAFKELREAIAAKDERIAKLEAALRVAIKRWEESVDSDFGCSPADMIGKESEDYAIALEALK